jgi:hypothetical protein
MKNIDKLITQHTDEEGNIDYEALETRINEEVNNIVAKNKPDTSKLREELKGEVAAEIISGLGVEGNSVDDLKLWAKKMGGSTDEIKEQNIALEKQLKHIQEQYESVEQKKLEYEQNYKNQEALSKVRKFGVKDDDAAEFIKFKVEKTLTEDTDFDTALENFREENPHYFREQGISTFRKIDNPQDTVSVDQDADVLAAFESKYTK